MRYDNRYPRHQQQTWPSTLWTATCHTSPVASFIFSSLISNKPRNPHLISQVEPLTGLYFITFYLVLSFNFVFFFFKFIHLFAQACDVSVGLQFSGYWRFLELKMDHSADALRTDLMTITRFVLNEQSKHPESRGDFTILLNHIVLGCKFVCSSVNKVLPSISPLILLQNHDEH